MSKIKISVVIPYGKEKSFLTKEGLKNFEGAMHQINTELEKNKPDESNESPESILTARLKAAFTKWGKVENDPVGLIEKIVLMAENNHKIYNDLKNEAKDKAIELENSPKIYRNTLEKQLLSKYFSRPEKRDEANAFLTTNDIKKFIEKQSNHRISDKNLSNALIQFKYEKWNRVIGKHSSWVWSVIKDKN